jgi:hypothetical protein
VTAFIELKNLYGRALGSNEQATHPMRTSKGHCRQSLIGEEHSQCSRMEAFRDVACSAKQISDKVEEHNYQVMYGQFLLPLQRLKRPIKVLEIGLGCQQVYGPGASAALWRRIFPNAELWMAEYNAECVSSGHRQGKFTKDRIHTLVGDQANRTTLSNWIRESGGNFDVVIDDGGHSNSQILTSFEVLWPEVRAGGFYFLEALQVSRQRGNMHNDLDRRHVAIDVIKGWIGELLIVESLSARLQTNRGQGGPRSWHLLPPRVAYVSCQREACVVAKACAEGSTLYN